MNKKVFISYSWGTKEHQDWVLYLAKRLMSDTVDVELDKWSLKDGHDIFSFMESMVKSDEIFRVLIICDQNYKIKSDERKGGVGTETQIITPEIYGNQNQEKFIPIVRERDEDNNAHLPVFLSSRKYIDFSSEEFFEDSYEELLRNILEAPSYAKPQIGTTVPTYITESNVNNNKTNSLLRTVQNQLLKYPEKVNSYAREFFEAFLENLWEFELMSKSHDPMTFGDDMVANLRSYKEIREDFILFLKLITKPELKIDIDLLIEFFEKKPIYSRPKNPDRNSWNAETYESFMIIFHELFIYTICICYKNKNYKLIENLLHSKYLFNDERRGTSQTLRYTHLYTYSYFFEEYYTKRHNKSTGMGSFMISNLSKEVRKNEFVFADTLCHYIGELYSNGDIRDSWFPHTHIYKGNTGFDFFQRMNSLRHFEKVKGIFDVKSPNELTDLITAYKEKKAGEERIKYGKNWISTIPFVFEEIDLNKIAVDR